MGDKVEAIDDEVVKVPSDVICIDDSDVELIHTGRVEGVTPWTVMTDIQAVKMETRAAKTNSEALRKRQKKENFKKSLKSALEGMDEVLGMVDLDQSETTTSCRTRSKVRELNNNKPTLVSQIPNLCVDNPPVRERMPNVPVSLRFYVETTFFANDSHRDLISIACDPIGSSQILPSVRDSMSTGYAADLSRGGSLSSGSAMSLTSRVSPAFVRTSNVSSTTSSASNIIPSSAAQSRSLQMNRVHSISPPRISYLRKKWGNSNLVYEILNYVDKALEEPSRNSSRTMKEHLSIKRIRESVESGRSDRKRTRQESPLHTNVEGLFVDKQVYAFWLNKMFYYGKIIEIFKERNVVKICFGDEPACDVPENMIITNLNSLIGLRAMVIVKPELHVPGVIVSLRTTPINQYTVVTDSGDFFVIPNKVYVSELEAINVLKEKSIIEFQLRIIEEQLGSVGTQTCRTRVVDQSGLIPDINQPSCSGMQSRFTKSGSSSSDDVSILKVKRDKNEWDTESEKYFELYESDLKLKSIIGKIPTRHNEKDEAVLGPLTSSRSWFTGYYFLVTVFSGPQNWYEKEGPYSENIKVPFSYDRIIQQIRLAGGTVVDRIEEVPVSQRENLFLIPNRPCLTAKYIRCLTFGVKIVFHEWIINCARSDSIVPYTLMPAGWSLELGRFVTVSERMTNRPFLNLTVYVAHDKTPSFSKFWLEICSGMGADAFLYNKYKDDADLIIAENGMRLQNENTPVVSSMFAIQCIIHGQFRDLKGHPMYSNLYEEQLW